MVRAILKKMNKGFFVSLEGNDGAGKTSVAQALSTIFQPCIVTREPGGSTLAEALRHLLLDSQAIDGITETLLFAAARRAHLQDCVLPALAEGKLVICDRFIDSSLAYQGVARKVGFKQVWDINQFAIEGRLPDLTLFLAVDEQVGYQRMSQRTEANRLDKEASSFHQAVRQGYEQAVAQFPERIVVIDANQPLDKVVEDCAQAIRRARCV